jgi:Zn-dependent protease with chaperone function
MTVPLHGRYFFPGSARFALAQATLTENGAFCVRGADGAVLGEAAIAAIRISHRLGRLPRRFDLPGGGCFETEDNEAADTLLSNRGKGVGWIHRLERSWRWALVSVAFAGFAAYAFVVFGIPACALWLALHTPPAMSTLITEQTLDLLDKTAFAPSKLSAADSAKAETLFRKVAVMGKHGPGGYRLLIRNSETVGPNAYSLSDGTVIVTDQLWALVKNDDEIEGVFAHEIAHVDRGHVLQSIYQAALVPAAIAFATGDASQAGQLAVVLSGLLLQTAYSRRMEQQADDDDAVTLEHMGADPARLADLLERMDAHICKTSGCGPSWLGTHPATAERAARLRHAGS